ncbi:hypothetical protein LOY44_17765 [Pseudomonas sp. B21-044]|uniref:hypothetical protein n=1 Tax=Pseudomonas sp. B21-044 TaxID=2895488 RepID=UPI002160CE2B|nr:hypothetical protein [Pseudomonas sp. B21-044]UVL17841.1 hypothetical protein LOY44_17765 [Pseudomonas sp. B21-044]
MTPAEQAGIQRWDTETSWLDNAAGRKLTIEEKATLITELGTTGALAIIRKRGQIYFSYSNFDSWRRTDLAFM